MMNVSNDLQKMAVHSREDEKEENEKEEQEAKEEERNRGRGRRISKDDEENKCLKHIQTQFNKKYTSMKKIGLCHLYSLRICLQGFLGYTDCAHCPPPP